MTSSHDASLCRPEKALTTEPSWSWTRPIFRLDWIYTMAPFETAAFRSEPKGTSQSRPVVFEDPYDKVSQTQGTVGPMYRHSDIVPVPLERSLGSNQKQQQRTHISFRQSFPKRLIDLHKVGTNSISASDGSKTLQVTVSYAKSGLDEPLALSTLIHSLREALVSSSSFKVGCQPRIVAISVSRSLVSGRPVSSPTSPIELVWLPMWRIPLIVIGWKVDWNGMEGGRSTVPWPVWLDTWHSISPRPYRQSAMQTYLDLHHVHWLNYWCNPASNVISLIAISRGQSSDDNQLVLAENPVSGRLEDV